MHSKAPDGFILLEVLVAMSFILGVWMASIGAYQGLALKLSQLEARRIELRQAWDLYEHAQWLGSGNHGVTQHPSSKASTQNMKHESSRMSRRNRALHNFAQSATSD